MRQFTERFSNISADVLAPGIIPLTASLDDVNKFREAMRREGDPCGFTSVQQEYFYLIEGLHRTPLRRGQNEPRSTHPNNADDGRRLMSDDERGAAIAADEVGRSVRRMLARTPAGRSIGRRVTRQLHEAQVAEMGEEEHKRRLLGLIRGSTRGEAGDEERRLSESINVFSDGALDPDKTCFKASAPGHYIGTEISTTCGPSGAGDRVLYGGCSSEATQCEPWSHVLRVYVSGPCADLGGIIPSNKDETLDQMGCICQLVGGTLRPWKDRNSGGASAIAGLMEDGVAYPRSFCQDVSPEYAFLETAPWCFYRKPWHKREIEKGNRPDATQQERDRKDRIVNKGLGLTPASGRLNACFEDLYNFAKSSYGCITCANVQGPFNPAYAWHLARISGGLEPEYKNVNNESQLEDAFNRQAPHPSRPHTPAAVLPTS